MSTKFNAASTTKPRAKRKATVTEDVHATYAQAQAEYMAALNVPSARRVIVAHVTAFAVNCGMYYGVIAPVINWLTLGAMVSTGSTFIGFAVAVLSLAVTFLVMIKTSRFVVDHMVAFDVDAARERVTSRINAVTSKLRGFIPSFSVPSFTLGGDHA